MQLAAEKNCWLADLDNVPVEELTLWAAYYELEHERTQKEEKKLQSG